MLADAFLSIVDKGDDTHETLVVRARRAGDIERVFPGAEVVEGAGTDYPFRARIDRETVACRIAEAVRRIDWSNFKNAVHDPELKRAYHDVWARMAELQARPPAASGRV